MSNKLFDSHCHLHFSQYDNGREEVINRLREAGIKVINVGTNLVDSQKAINLANKYSDLMWASVGIHPNDVDSEIDLEKLKKLTSNEKVVAIGECGLDYALFVREQSERLQKGASTEVRQLANEGGLLEEEIKNRQKEIFIKQIELAKELNKPLILHCRASAGTQDAYEDVIEILKFKNLNISTGNGTAHFFAGSKETAKKFLDLGFCIGFSGPITFADEYREVVEFVPINRILIETDAPFATPAPHRGKRNEPAYVEFVARKIAEWKETNFKEITEQTTQNTFRLFQLK